MSAILQNTPINRAFLFLYAGVRKGSIKAPDITDMSDANAESFPVISCEEYMRKALEAQIAHEAAQPHVQTYTFHRAEGFYPIELQSDAAALANVPCNPGTLKVVNETTGKTIYEKEGK